MVRVPTPLDVWDNLRPGEPVSLQAASPLHRDPYPLQVLGHRDGRLEVSYPMKDGHIVLIPIGTLVTLRTGSNAHPPVESRVVERNSGATRSLLLARPQPDTPLVTAKVRAVRAPVITVASGKGGVGTTVLAANIAVGMAAAGKTACLVDAVVGTGNADVLLNMQPRATLRQVLRKERTVFEAATRGPGGVLLVAAGDPAEGPVGRRALDHFVAALNQLARYVDVVVVDAGTGANQHVAALLAVADERVIVTTPEPHAVVDAYALLRAVADWMGPFSCRLLINMVADEEEGESVGKKMQFAAERFLGVDMAWLGGVPRDRLVEGAVRRQQPFVLHSPAGPAGRMVAEVARALLGEQVEVGGAPRGLQARWQAFWRRLATAQGR